MVTHLFSDDDDFDYYSDDSISIEIHDLLDTGSFQRKDAQTTRLESLSQKFTGRVRIGNCPLCVIHSVER
jgi:hypothetical protein